MKAALIAVLLAAQTATADEVFFYPAATLQTDECGTWAEDGAGGVLWDSAGTCWEGGGYVEFGWRGGGDTAWAAREINGPMTGKHVGYLSAFEYHYDGLGNLWLVVTDVGATPEGEPETPGSGTGEPGGGCTDC